MIKLPEEVGEVFKTLENNGYKAYAVGGCVRDSLLGISPSDFDIATNARLDDMKRLLPDAEILSEKLSVIRFDYSKGKGVAENGNLLDIATFRVEGEYIDRKRPDTVCFVDDIERDLARRDFTINAMAENPSLPIVDPYGGQADIRNGIIRTVGDPELRLREDPVRMLRAVRFASRFDFDIQSEVYDAIIRNVQLLDDVSKEVRRSEFEKIITGENAGKGIRLMLETGTMRYILGAKAYESLEKAAFQSLYELAAKIDTAENMMEIRLGLFYGCFESELGDEAVCFLEYPTKMKKMLSDAVQLKDKMLPMHKKAEIKDFLAEYGQERYDCLHRLAKASEMIYAQYGDTILEREAALDEIKRNGEPIYIKDLAVDGKMLIENGIAKGETVGKVLTQLAYDVHRRPHENTKELLLKAAARYSQIKI